MVRREERKAIGRALTDLMEVRHRFLMVPKAVEAITRVLKLPADARAPLKIVLGTLFPPDQGLGKRYEESVSLVGEMNPILPFRLLSQDLIGQFLHQLRVMARTACWASSAQRPIGPPCGTDRDHRSAPDDRLQPAHAAGHR